MSVRFDAAADELKTTTNIVANASWTMMAWVYLKVASASAGFFSCGDSGSASYFEILADASRVMTLYNGSTTSAGSTIALNQWYHLAATCAGTGANQFKLYINGRQDISMSGHAHTMNTMTFGTSADSADDVNCRLCAGGIWDTPLTQAEVQTQMRFGYAKVRPEKVNRFLPMRTHATARQDGTVKLRHMTVGGTLTTESDPPFLLWQPDVLSPVVQRFAAAGGGSVFESFYYRFLSGAA